MKYTAESPEEYIDQLPEERKTPFIKFRKAILENLPEGFVEIMSYGMIGYVVPHSLYPDGYHCDPKLPLAFMNLASQKKHITLYHMGIYGSPELLAWYTNEYDKLYHAKPDMGKGCIRFSKMDMIPFQLIGELAGKITPADWIRLYETNYKR